MGLYLLAVSEAGCSFTADSTPEADGTGDAESGLALSAVEDTFRTAIWISMGPYLLAVSGTGAADSRPEADGTGDAESGLALSAIEDTSQTAI